MYTGQTRAKSDRMVLEEVAKIYARIAGREMPVPHENYEIIHPRTRQHAYNLCNSIAARRKQTISYHPD